MGEQHWENTLSLKASPSTPLHRLTAREGEVICLLARGLSNPRIAETLVISRKTVEHHLDHIYGKIGVTCRTAAVAYALQNGLC